MKSSSFLLFTIFCLLFCACQSVYVPAPTPSIDTPEIQIPKRDVSLEFGLKSSGMLEVSRNAGRRPPTMGDGEIHPDAQVSGHFGYAPRNDMIFKVGLFGPAILPTGLSFKTQGQILGSDYLSSMEGNHSASLITELMYYHGDRSGDQEYFGGPGHRDWKASGRMSAATLAFSYGYRSSKDLLYFLGGGYGVFKTGGKIKQSATDTYPEGEYDMTDRAGNTTSTAIGFDLYNRSAEINFVAKLVYYHINHDQQSLGRLGIEVASSF